MSSVLILNAGYEPLHRVSIQHAIRMLVREVAVVEESIDDKTIGHFPFPLVLRLVRYVKLNWRSSTPKWSKRRLLERDHYCCVYCGKQATTVDHVIPRVNGGETTWLNTVSACLRCNGKKGSSSIEKSGMKLTKQPFKPTWKDITH
jgi:5-methylcytosine-specific restriction endonuclease McrA